MNKVIKAMGKKVLMARGVHQAIEKVSVAARVKAGPEVMQAFLASLDGAIGGLPASERDLTFAAALSRGDEAALAKLLNYVISRAAEVKNIEDFLKSRAEAAKDEQALDLSESLTPGDIKALEELATLAVESGGEGCLIVEVGSWKGMSTSVLAGVAAKHKGKVFAIDHWMGSENAWNFEVARSYDIYAIFKRNMMLLGLWPVVHPLVMDSVTASSIFADGVADMVFIDADHRYDSVKQDISLWLPKLKKGGLLCGHDCEGYYSAYPAETKAIIDRSPGEDYIRNVGAGVHPGVVKGLHDCFGTDYSIVPDSVVWYRKNTA